VDDVTQGAEADDQKTGQVAVRMRASRSRVAWSLGSPTIAVRPP
jgi:outer membrane protein assembly factor BamE (lipoprotein component of BamABCDE complex)